MLWMCCRRLLLHMDYIYLPTENSGQPLTSVAAVVGTSTENSARDLCWDVQAVSDMKTMIHNPGPLHFECGPTSRSQRWLRTMLHPDSR